MLADQAQQKCSILRIPFTDKNICRAHVERDEDAGTLREVPHDLTSQSSLRLRPGGPDGIQPRRSNLPKTTFMTSGGQQPKSAHFCSALGGDVKAAVILQKHSRLDFAGPPVPHGANDGRQARLMFGLDDRSWGSCIFTLWTNSSWDEWGSFMS